MVLTFQTVVYSPEVKCFLYTRIFHFLLWTKFETCMVIKVSEAYTRGLWNVSFLLDGTGNKNLKNCLFCVWPWFWLKFKYADYEFNLRREIVSGVFSDPELGILTSDPPARRDTIVVNRFVYWVYLYYSS